jgi:tight adherence protein B
VILPILAFLFATGLVLGGYYAVTILPPKLAARRMERRLRELNQTSDEVEASLLMARAQGPLPVLDRFVGTHSRGASVSRLIDQSGVRTTPSAMAAISLLAGLTVGLCTAWFLPYPLAALGAGVAGMALPFLWLAYRRSSRLKKFEEQFPEALDLLSRAIRAGHAFQSAMGMVADELPPPVGVEFKKTFDRQNFGLPLNDTMNEMADRVPILDVRFFVTAVAIQRETGGNLSEILDNLAHVVRERFKIRRQVRVHTAHGRFTGYVLLSLPAALAVALTFISPGHMNILFKDPMGQMMVMGAIVMQTIGFIWIRQVIKIEV